MRNSCPGPLHRRCEDEREAANHLPLRARVRARRAPRELCYGSRSFTTSLIRFQAMLLPGKRHDSLNSSQLSASQLTLHAEQAHLSQLFLLTHGSAVSELVIGKA